MFSLPIIAGYALVAVNVVLFLLMGWDKQRARKSQYRVAERTLLLLGLAGGGIGGLLGMQLFRHKTRHGRFYVAYAIGAAVASFGLALL